MNIIIIDKKKYLIESNWSKYGKKTDINNNPFPKLKKSVVMWERDNYLNKIKALERIASKKNYKPTSPRNRCFLCDHKEKKGCQYTLNDIKWDSILTHYVISHSVKPSSEFLDFIFRYDINFTPDKKKPNYPKINGIKQRGYLKINTNQLNILDALLYHGGNKYYHDKKNKEVLRYSEHAGLLHFNKEDLSKIVIFANTIRVDDADDDIYFPSPNSETFKHKYIFHTHPPTPSPGGRYEVGVLYEFPSINDIFHFTDNYKLGKTRGSIVIAAEGMYIIRKYNSNSKKKIDEDVLYKKFSKISGKCQDEAIKKYTPFSTEKFYSIIAQDLTFINKINNLLRVFNLWIDFYPRTKYPDGNWYIKTVKLPL